MSDKSDWRLTNQEAWLKGITLYRQAYRAYPDNKDWDHDHCAFCWDKFTVSPVPGTLQEGFTTEDEYHWICPQCFDDFKTNFEWVVAVRS
jgi:hypothetical protein